MSFDQSLADIQEMFSKGSFFDLIEKHIDLVSQIKHTDNPDKLKRNAEILYYLLAACMECGYYCDYLDVFKKYDQVVPFHRIILSSNTKRIIVVFALEALVYCLYNNGSEGLGVTYNIAEKIETVMRYLDKLNHGEDNPSLDRRQAELQGLYADYQEGKRPIYTVEYLYPFEPVVPDYTFDLSACYPYISMEVRKVSRDNDSFTNYKFKAYGLIKPDAFWKGPKCKNREKFPPIRKTLDIVNAMLLQAVKASPGKMILPYSIEQVSTVSMFQYRRDEKEHILGGTIFGTDFSADWVGNNARWHEFTPDEMVELNRRIVNVYATKPFVTTFHHATNLLSAGFYLEAFTLLCFSCEGMVYHWLGELAERNGIQDEYEQFRNSKFSKCDSCGYFTGSEKKKPSPGMKPSLFMNIGLFYNKGIISKSERDKITRLISKIRNDDIRNETVHGNNAQISKPVVKQSLESILELQEILRGIADKA